MDRRIPTADYPQSKQCKMSPLCSPICEQTMTCRHYSVLHRKSNYQGNGHDRKPTNTPQISKTCKDLFGARITTTPQTHCMGSCNRALTRSSRHAPRKITTANTSRDQRSTEICRGTPKTQYHPTILEPIRCKLLLCEEER